MRAVVPIQIPMVISIANIDNSTTGAVSACPPIGTSGATAALSARPNKSRCRGGMVCSPKPGRNISAAPSRAKTRPAASTCDTRNSARSKP